MSEAITEVRTFGDVRRLIVQTIMQVRDGGLTTAQASVMASNMKELNANIQCEINAAKVAMQAAQAGYDFGGMVRMGQRKIGGD